MTELQALRIGDAPGAGYGDGALVVCGRVVRIYAADGKVTAGGGTTAGGRAD